MRIYTRRHIVARMSDKLTITDTCWLWSGAKRKGYGQIKGSDHRTRYAHIEMYKHFVGPIPLGLELDHICNTPACVRPSHLEPVTHSENIRRSGTRNIMLAKAAKTHCVRGHPLSGDNLQIRGHSRRCRTCDRTYRERKASES